MWELSKRKEGILEISPIVIEFEDSYSRVHLRDYYITKYKLKAPGKVDKMIMPSTYEALSSLINDINCLKPREFVPNKKVTTDVEGTSKLIRSKDKTRIEICYRVRNKSGKIESSAKSNNTCYISIADRELFFKHAKEAGSPVRDSFGHDHYYLDYNDYNFWYWSEFMDREYYRLAGITPPKTPQKPQWTTPEKELAETCLAAYTYTAPGTDGAIFERMAERGLAMINDKGTSLYNINGYWICEFEELAEKDKYAYMLKSVLDWLTYPGLLKAKRILEEFIPEDLEEDIKTEGEQEDEN